MRGGWNAALADMDRVRRRFESLRDGDEQARAVEELERKFAALHAYVEILEKQIHEAPQRMIEALANEGLLPTKDTKP